MKAFRGKSAVITGAASGIGYAIANKCVQEGMSVLLTDINGTALLEASEKIRIETPAGKIHTFAADVSKPTEIDSLKTAADKYFDNVDMLVNAAGVLINKMTWNLTVDDWDFVRGVNIDGTLNTIRSFVPDMIKNNQPGHIVNVGSMASFLPSPTLAAYNMSKFAILAMTETLKYDLDMIGAPIGVSLLAPGPVQTAIMAPADNSIRARDDDVGSQVRTEMDAGIKAIGMHPSEVAEIVFAGIKDEKFWLLTHAEFMHGLPKRAERILAAENPVYKPDSL